MPATGVGSMPGLDYAEALRVVRGEIPDLVALPELPARGAAGQMIGRGLAVVEDIAADIVPGGWRLTARPGIDQRRARRLLAHDLDLAEEHLAGVETLKVQICGPWTLAAQVELPRGEKVLADHGARRDLAAALAGGLERHLAQVRRRLEPSSLLVQVDEPALPTVLAGGLPTASGLYRYRAIEPAEADAALRGLVDVITGAEARPVFHSCARDLPVGLLCDAGFAAISFDAGTTPPDDAWAAAFEAGVDLWPGIVPALRPGDVDEGRIAEEAAERVAGFFARLGFDASSFSSRLVVTPACGLAGAEPAWSVRALGLARRIAGELGGRSPRSR